jgi:hypothetical protein
MGDRNVGKRNRRSIFFLRRSCVISVGHSFFFVGGLRIVQDHWVAKALDKDDVQRRREDLQTERKLRRNNVSFTGNSPSLSKGCD